MAVETALDRLSKKHPWPDVRPAAEPADWALDGGGRELITDLIVKRNVSVLLEIGAFLGNSARRWLETSPDLVVIAVDPWSDNSIDSRSREEFARLNGRPDLCNQFAKKDGFYHTFLTNMWDYRDRLIPIRDVSPAALYSIHEAGVAPDLVYLDADKSGRELEVCHRLFPNAVITGDDWTWGPEKGCPIQEPVKQFCSRHGFYLKLERDTWVIDENPPTLRERLREARSRWRRIRHGIRAALRKRAA